MARHYSTKDFFRQMPNALLARYFQGRGLFDELNFAAMKEAQPDGLFARWLALPDAQRNEMDAEFQDIFELSCEKGFRAIIDEAEWHLAPDAAARTAFFEKLALRRVKRIRRRPNPVRHGAGRCVADITRRPFVRGDPEETRPAQNTEWVTPLPGNSRQKASLPQPADR